MIVSICGVNGIENEAAEGAGETMQRENIPMLPEESPDLRLFPLSSLPQSLQC